MQWHAGIGNFYRHVYPLIKINKNLLSFSFDLRLTLMNFFYSFFSENFLLLHGDIEGPKKYKSYFTVQKNISPLLAVFGM